MMKHRLLLCVAVTLLSSTLMAEDVRLNDKTVLRFASVPEGQEILTTADDYLKRLSPFDLAARLETDAPVTLEQFKEHLAAQVLAWNEEQESQLRPILTAVADKLKRWKLNLPKTIHLVRTTGIDEGHAAYTRGSAIVLPDEKLAGPTNRLTDLVIHELFHVLSRHNPQLRDELYRIVGFEAIDEITLPETLARRKITNPDAPLIAHAAKLTIEDEHVYVVPLLFSVRETYDSQRGGTIFDYLQFRLLAVERTGGGWQVAQSDGEPRLFSADEAPDYLATIGRNTRYIIHPEEVLADNFVLLVNGRTDVATRRILAELDRSLRQPAADPSG